MVKAVLFDWNGTLLDDLGLLAYGSVVKIFESHDIPSPTLEQYRQEIAAKFMDFYYRHGFVPNFSGQGPEGDAKALNKIRKQYYLDHDHKVKIRPDAVRTVLNLRVMKIKVGIVSAEIESSLLTKLSSSDLHNLIDNRFIRAEAWGDKTAALLDVCQRLGVPPADALYVDDTVDGAKAAQNAGLVSIGFANKTGYNSEDRLRIQTPFIINELSELLSLVEDMNEIRAHGVKL